MTNENKDTASSVQQSNVPPDHDGSSWYTAPEGWTSPTTSDTSPDIQAATQEDYDAVVRALILPHEEFWRKHADHEMYRSFVKDKTEAERKLLAEAFQLDIDTASPTLDSCIPRGSLLEVVDRYFWEYTDIPRELPFFYVMHFIMGLLLQKGVEIHKGQQVILPDIWTVVVATSGTGKSLSQKQLDKALNAKINLFNEAKTSLQFLTNLRDQRLSLYLRDEFAQFLKDVSKEPSMQNVRDYLLRTYDNGNIEYTTTKSSVEVKNSAISILGYTPTKTLKMHLTQEMLLDGFAQRFSYCVSEKDDRPIVGDYDFDALSKRIAPLWNQLSSQPVHPVYTVTNEARGVFNHIARTIIGDARAIDVEDSFSRRLAFTTYKYGLAYHFMAGKTASEIDGDDLVQGAKLVALHLRDLRKILDFYEPAAGKNSRPAGTPSPAPGVGENGAVEKSSLPTVVPTEVLTTKIISYLNDRKNAGADPVTISKLHGSIRALRTTTSEAVRVVVKQAISDNPSLSPFVKL